MRDQVGILQVQKVPVFFYADGNIMPVLTDILASGVNELHSLDFSALTDIAIVKKATENNLCLMGGYDLGWFSEENRTERATELLAVVADGGAIYLAVVPGF